jgi:hypothetical protein
MGESQMGRYRFSSWTLHMASIIIFSSLWGIGFKEWNGSGARQVSADFGAVSASRIHHDRWLRKLSGAGKFRTIECC